MSQSSKPSKLRTKRQSASLKSPSTPSGTAYKCPHCGKTVTRESSKAWIKSLCEKTGRMTRLSRQPAKRGRKAWEPPPGVDWARPAMHIARDCGVATPTVICYMRRQGILVRAKGVPKGTKFATQSGVPCVDPSSIDWRYQDQHLAGIHGVTRERIRQLRKAAGLPPSSSPGWLAAGGIVTMPKYRGGRPKKP